MIRLYLLLLIRTLMKKIQQDITQKHPHCHEYRNKEDAF